MKRKISSNYNKKNIFMRFKPFTEKIRKKIEFCLIVGRIRIHYPGSGSADPDPHQETLIWILLQKKIVINSHTNQPKL